MRDVDSVFDSLNGLQQQALAELFQLQQNLRMADYTRNMMLVAVLVTLAFWPFDVFFLPEDLKLRTAFLTWRSSFVVLGIVSVFLFQVFRFVRENAFWFWMPTFAALAGAAAYSLAPFGGLESPFFHCYYLGAVFALVFPMGNLARAASNLFFLGVWMGIYFVGFPEYMDHPLFMNQVLLIVFLFVFVQFLGMYGYRQAVASFVLAYDPEDLAALDQTASGQIKTK